MCAIIFAKVKWKIPVKIGSEICLDIYAFVKISLDVQISCKNLYCGTMDILRLLASWSHVSTGFRDILLS